VPKIDGEHHWLRAASSRVGHLFPGLLSQPACNRRLLWWATNVGAGGGAGRAEQAQADQPEGPLAKTVGSSARWEARSKTKLATQAPIGTVTRMGCKGCP
jgi:hypothetical protein